MLEQELKAVIDMPLPPPRFPLLASADVDNACVLPEPEPGPEPQVQTITGTENEHLGDHLPNVMLTPYSPNK